MLSYLEKATQEIAKERDAVIERLVAFSQTDMLLFWGSDAELVARQEKVWAPLLKWGASELKTTVKPTNTLDVTGENKNLSAVLSAYLHSFSDRELAAFYVAALNMKSVLLAIALVKKRLNAREAFEAAYLEELWQAEKWGVEEEAENRRHEMLKELQDVEAFLR